MILVGCSDSTAFLLSQSRRLSVIQDPCFVHLTSLEKGFMSSSLFAIYCFGLKRLFNIYGHNIVPYKLSSCANYTAVIIFFPLFWSNTAVIVDETH